MTAPLYEDGDWRKPVKARRTDLSEQQEAFLEWLTDPEVQIRNPSQNSYAAEVGCNKSTLSKWKKDPLFVKAWEAKLAQMNVRPERMQSLMDVLYDQGKDGSVKAIELYFKLNDRMTPERHVIEVEKSAIEMSDEEIAAELQRRADALRGGTVISAVSRITTAEGVRAQLERDNG